MELIDDQGRLFGRVNVVDALVVLLVAAVVIAGVALVTQPEPAPGPAPDVETTYATLDAGTLPAYVVSAVDAGDTYEPNDASSLTVTDVYLAPANDGTRVLLRVALEGEVNDESLYYDGAPPRLGRTLTIATDRYQVDGQIRAVGDGDSLDRRETDVLLEATVDAQTAERIAEGDVSTVDGVPVGTVESVSTYATADPETKRVFVGLALTTVEQNGRPTFGDTHVQHGNDLTFRTDAYAVTGQIERVGTTEEPGSAATRTATLRIEGIHESMAGAIRPGMTERSGGETVAELTDVDVEPSIVILQGDNGSLGVYDHPVQRDVTLTADLRVRETAAGVTFKGEPVRQGQTVTLDLGTVTIEATVVSL